MSYEQRQLNILAVLWVAANAALFGAFVWAVL